MNKEDYTNGLRDILIDTKKRQKMKIAIVGATLLGFISLIIWVIIFLTGTFNDMNDRVQKENRKNAQLTYLVRDSRGNGYYTNSYTIDEKTKCVTIHEDSIVCGNYTIMKQKGK